MAARGTTVTHLSEEQLVAHRFGDAGAAERPGAEAHLAECPACRRLLGDIDATLLAAARMPVPERSDGYGAEVWARIQPRLERTGKGARWAAAWSFLAPRRLALAGGLAMLVAAAFVAGRYWPGTPAPAPGQQSGSQSTPVQANAPNRQVQRQVLLVAVGDHLERSQSALVELVNASNGPRVDISDEQARARDLVAENRLYRQTAEDSGEAGMASVLDDLERVLVEIANGPSELPKADFERVRQQIEGQGIIFKVRVLGQRVREREREARVASEI